MSTELIPSEPKKNRKVQLKEKSGLILPLPWERQPNEPWRIFNAFITYRDLMPTERNMDVLSRMTGKTPSTLKRWAREWEWEERVAAFLDHRDEKNRQVQLELRQQMFDRHATIAVKFLDKVNQRLETLTPEEIEAKDLIKFADIAIKMERVARGEASEVVKNETTNTQNVNFNASIDSKSIISDKGAADIACQLLERVMLGGKGVGKETKLPPAEEIKPVTVKTIENKTEDLLKQLEQPLEDSSDNE